MVPAGRLADLVGRKRLFLAGLGVFVAQPGNDLTKRARKERLLALADELLTAAVHLGFSADEVLGLVSERLSRYQWVQPTLSE